MLRLLTFLLLLPFFSIAQASFVPDERAYYGLIDRGSGRCLDIAGASPTNGAAAVQWEFTHAPSQQWRFVPIRPGSEYFRIEARHSGQCLTVDKPGEGTALVQRPFQGSEQQQWRLVPAGPAGSFQLENRSESRVAALAASDKFNGTPVVAQKGNGRASQQWRLFRLRLNLLEGPALFGPPQPLPAAINTPANEVHPVLSPRRQHAVFRPHQVCRQHRGQHRLRRCLAEPQPRPRPNLGSRHAPRRHQYSAKQRRGIDLRHRRPAAARARHLRPRRLVCGRRG